jgi:DNA-binding winged helix-turn-helix (wHTH) protein/tetratricopeptide (TPR) repeat protein
MDTKPTANSIFRFGVFEVDLRSGELRKHGIQVKVQDSPLRALRLLLLHPQQVLSRQEFRSALWGEEVFVDFDRAINTTINRLRETLGDVSSNPVFIETVSRSGYRWIAPVEVVSKLGETLAKVDTPRSQASQIENRPSLIGKGSRPRLRWVTPAVAVLCAGGLLGLIWQRSHGASGLVPNKLSAARTASPIANRNASKKAHDPEAEELYLTGRYYWNKRTPDALRHAADSFTQAIVHDPGYAEAYVGLADTFNLLREFASMPDAEAYPRAFSAASRAVELDDSSAEAHATLGFVSFWWKRDVSAADREFQRALALDPLYVDGYHWYANVLGCEGRTAEDLKYLNRAQQLDPASPSIRADKASALVLSGRRQEGVALLKQIEASDPDFASPHLYLSDLYLSELDCRGYLAEERILAQLRGRPDDMLVERAAEKGFATSCPLGMLHNILVAQKKLYTERRLGAYQIARTEALLGDRTASLSYLGIAMRNNESELACFRVDLALSRLHSVPAFQQLLTQAGLPPLSLQTPN